MKKILLSLLCAAATIAASAESYTIQFSYSGGADNGTSISKSADFVAGIAKDSQKFVTSASDFSNVYKVANQTALKLGSNKNPGKVKMTLAQDAQVVASSIDVYIKRCNTTGAPGISVNGAACQTVTTASDAATYGKYSFTISDTKAISEISLNTGTTDLADVTTAKKGAIYIDKIVVNYTNAGETPEQPEQPAEPTITVSPELTDNNGDKSLTIEEGTIISFHADNATFFYVDCDKDDVRLSAENGTAMWEPNATVGEHFVMVSTTVDDKELVEMFDLTITEKQSGEDPNQPTTTPTAQFNFIGENPISFEGVTKPTTASNGVSLDGKSVTIDAVTLGFAKGTGSTTVRWWATSNGNEVRMYSGDKMTISVSGNNRIDEITFTTGSDSSFGTPSTGSISNKVWKPADDGKSVSTVTIPVSGKTFLQSVNVKYSSTINTSISEIEAGNGVTEWYDLSGRRVVAPTKGVYIRRQGNKTTKIAY